MTFTTCTKALIDFNVAWVLLGGLVVWKVELSSPLTTPPPWFLQTDNCGVCSNLVASGVYFYTVRPKIALFYFLQ